MTTRHRACDDFRQTSASTRRSWVDAPLTRRRLIAGGLGATLAVYAAKAMPLTRMLEAAQAQAATAPNAPILVSVFLPGGVDLLDTLVPQAAYGAYADLRKGLKLPEAPALGSTGLGLHPALSAGARGGVKGLFDAGKIGFMPGIDYANPDLSHFHSRHFWETGLITQDQVPGWLGRWLDRRGGADNPFQGMTIGSTLSPVLRSSRVPVAAVTSPDDAQFWIRDTWGEAFERGVATWGRLAEGGSAKPGPAAVRDSTKLAMQVSERLAPYRSDEEKGFYPLKPPVAYPDFEANGLARSLSQLAGLLSLPLGVRSQPSRPRATSTPTTTSPASSTRGCDRSQRRSPPSRQTSRRAESPTASSPSCGRSSAAGPRATSRRAPTTAPAAWPGSREPARAAGSSPSTRASASSTATATSPSPSTSGGSMRACSSSGWAPTPAR